MATVYKAYQAALARHVAIKVLPDYLTDDSDFPQRFQREAVALASLRHPNIPAVFDYSTADDLTYIVCEYIDGGTLSEQMGEPLPLEYVVEILRPIASALDYAHARGVLHRDIKPSNIMLARDGRPVLNDFGLAQMMSTDGRITAAGTIMGTPQYMAPEQCAGQSLGPPADIYSLAVVAYEMLTGRVPFQAATPAAVILAQMQDPLPPPRSVNPQLSEAIEASLLKGLAKRPGDRFPTASAMIQSLAAPATSPPAVAPVPGDARHDTLPLGAGGGRGRRTALLAGAGVALLLVLGGGGYVLSRGLSAKTAAPTPHAGSTSVNGLPISVIGTPIPTLTDLPLAKGPLVWSANLADRASFKEPAIAPPGAAAARFGPGGLEVDILKPDGQVNMTANMPPMPQYVAEIDIRVAPGSHLSTNWVLRPGDGKENGTHVINVDASRTSFALKYLAPPGSADPSADVSDRYTTPEITNGSKFTLTVGAGGDEYVMYFNNREVEHVYHEHNAPPITLGLAVFGHDGSVVVSGMRVYELP
jgi:hypothetical protein